MPPQRELQGNVQRSADKKRIIRFRKDTGKIDARILLGYLGMNA